MHCVVLALLVASPAHSGTLDEIATTEGLPATAAALTELVAATKPGKKRDQALDSSGLDRISMPVKLAMGAELVLSEPEPLTACTWDGTVSCSFRAHANATARPEDYEVHCTSRLGARLKVKVASVPAPDGALGWVVAGVEKCWEIDAGTLVVQPVALDDLDVIGQGTDLIPPELVEMSWQEAEETIRSHLPEFRYCHHRHATTSGAGTLVVRYHIAEDGSVDSAEVDTQTVEDDAVVQCVLDRFRRLRFRPPMGGFEGGTFPFTFTR